MTNSITIAPNIYHQALSHLISENAQNNVSGYYRLKPNLEIDHDDAMPPQFNMVPLPNQSMYPVFVHIMV